MRNLLATAAIVLALAAPAYAQGMAGPQQSAGPMSGDNMVKKTPKTTMGNAMPGPAQPSRDGMMAGHGNMAMGKNKPKASAMKHDGMSGGAMSGPSQPARDGMNH